MATEYIEKEIKYFRTKYTDGQGNRIVIQLPQIKSKYTKALESKEAV